MPTYYYPFDVTSSIVSFANTETVPDDGWDVSEFSNDSRGTPRVADWADLTSFDADDFDVFTQALNYTSSISLGWTSYTNDTTRSVGNKYYKNLSSTNRAYFSVISIGEEYNPGGAYVKHTISTSPLRQFKIGSWYFPSPSGLKVLVYFPNYEANGGHDTLLVNNTTIVNWSSTNNRFQSSDENTTLSHNGSTWIISVSGSTSSTASYNSANVGDYIDPSSSDLVWTNSGSVTIPSSGVVGDPHINPIFGKPYTI